jgi:hypothetical protein
MTDDPLFINRHVHGDNPCGEVAFYSTIRPRKGTVMDLNTVRLLDGTIPSAATLMLCGTCGRQISPASVEVDGGYA